MTELSVVIATYNRAPRLERCLGALAVQGAAPDSFEVVVVDDGSVDHTQAVLHNFRDRLPLRVERIENSGQAAALNLGVELADGRFCLFLDDDVIASHRLVAEHLRAQRRERGVIALGNLGIDVREAPGGLARYVERWWEDQYGAFEREERSPSFRNCYSGNLSVPREPMVAAGGFADWLRRSFDVELAYRLTREGLRVVFVPGARAMQVYDKPFPAIVADFRAAGSAAVEMVRREPPILQHLPIGNYWQSGPREGIARRILLALRFPLALLRPFDSFLRGPRFDRFWRFVQEYAYWGGVRRAEPDRARWRSLVSGVVILLYHAIGERGERPSRYVLPAARFRRQLRLLRLLRYRVLSLDAYARHRAEHSLPPPRSVILTLDDGYRDNGEVAYPLLRARDLQATVFLVSEFVGGRNTWAVGSEVWGRPMLDWREIDELRQGGLRFGAHTRTHASLPGLSAAERVEEVSGCKEALEEKLGPVRHFAYPYGRLDEETVESVREAGFATAVGIEEGRNCAGTPIMRLRRCEVYGTDSLFRFASMLLLGKRRGT